LKKKFQNYIAFDSSPHNNVTVRRLFSEVPASARRQPYLRFGGIAFPPQPLAGVYRGVLIFSATSIRCCLIWAAL